MDGHDLAVLPYYLSVKKMDTFSFKQLFADPVRFNFTTFEKKPQRFPNDFSWLISEQILCCLIEGTEHAISACGDDGVRANESATAVTSIMDGQDFSRLSLFSHIYDYTESISERSKEKKAKAGAERREFVKE